MSPDVESRVIKRKVKKMDSGILFRDEDGFTTIAVYPPELKFDEIDFEEMDDDEMDIEELFRGKREYLGIFRLQKVNLYRNKDVQQCWVLLVRKGLLLVWKTL